MNHAGSLSPLDFELNYIENVSISAVIKKWTAETYFYIIIAPCPKIIYFRNEVHRIGS